MASVWSEVVTDDRRLEELAPSWDALLAETPGASGFQSFAWASACRASFASRTLRVLVVRDGGEIVGILPLELARGRLAFIGAAVANYLGPVYRPASLDAVVRALADLLAAERRIALLDFRGLRDGSPFLQALRDRPPPGWTLRPPVPTATCPFVDLTPGWAALLARHKGKQRANLGRKARMLERLGRVELVERTDADGLETVLPSLFRLFAGRWAGRHESGGFAGHQREFHLRSLPLLAAAGHLRLSLLTVDGELAAFAYGVRAGGITSSYVLAHDVALGGCSPGLLLLVRLLEAACERGDPEYDFSIGEEAYKEQWATGTRGVFRVLGWRRRSAAGTRARLEALGTRLWVAARSVELLRAARREGLGRLVFRRGVPARADAPGLPAGPVDRWSVHRVPAAPRDATVAVAPLRFARLAALLSPLHLGLAAERAFRGDVPLEITAAGRSLGIVWRAEPARGPRIARLAASSSEPVYYHPVATSGDVGALVRALAGSGGFVLVSPRPDPSLGEPLASFNDEPTFRSPPSAG